MAQLIWSPEARRRLIILAQYMQQVAPEQTETLIDRIITAAERLRDFPHLGRPLAVHDDPDARELIVDKFHLVYKTDGDTVEISSVLHGSLDIQARLHDLFGTD